MLPDVAPRHRAKHRINDRVKHDVAVAVGDGAQIIGNNNAGQQQTAPLLQAVKVVAVADAEWERSHSDYFAGAMRTSITPCGCTVVWNWSSKFPASFCRQRSRTICFPDSFRSD